MITGVAGLRPVNGANHPVRLYRAGEIQQHKVRQSIPQAPEGRCHILTLEDLHIVKGGAHKVAQRIAVKRMVISYQNAIDSHKAHFFLQDKRSRNTVAIIHQQGRGCSGRSVRKKRITRPEATWRGKFTGMSRLQLRPSHYSSRPGNAAYSVMTQRALSQRA